MHITIKDNDPMLNWGQVTTLIIFNNNTRENRGDG